MMMSWCQHKWSFVRDIRNIVCESFTMLFRLLSNIFWAGDVCSSMKWATRRKNIKWMNLDAKQNPVNKYHYNSLQWRHNERYDVSNHRCLDCLLYCLFRSKSMKTSEPRITGLCEGNPPVTGAKWPVARKMFPVDDDIMWIKTHQLPYKGYLKMWATKVRRFIQVSLCLSIEKCG